MANAKNATGLKYFTLAFVIDGGGCNATFNGDTSITDGSWTSAINSLRAGGGDVIASFGGASGSEEALACTSVAALEAQYKRVIDGQREGVKYLAVLFPGPIFNQFICELTAADGKVTAKRVLDDAG